MSKRGKSKKQRQRQKHKLEQDSDNHAISSFDATKNSMKKTNDCTIDKNKNGRRSEGTTSSVHCVIYCPTSNSTYTGHILPTDNNNNSMNNYVKHGKGILENHNTGSTIDAMFHNDQITGYGLETIQNKHTVLIQYEGTFQSTKTNITSSATGEVSSPQNNGNNDNDQHHQYSYTRHGVGKLIWTTTSDIYTGPFQNGQMSGTFGTFQWGYTGDTYEGPWKNNQMHGRGGVKHTVKTGDVFVGRWRKGMACGWGKKIFGNGDVHEGMYYKDKRKGLGMYKWQNGETYVGQWDDGRMVGRGMKVLPIPTNTRITHHHNRHRRQQDDIDDDDHEDVQQQDDERQEEDNHQQQQQRRRRARAAQTNNTLFHTMTNHNKSKHKQSCSTSPFQYGVQQFPNGDVHYGQYSPYIPPTTTTNQTNKNNTSYNHPMITTTYKVHESNNQRQKLLRNGHGTYTWSETNDTYDGQWLNGYMSGYGIKRFGIISNNDDDNNIILESHGDVYEGEWWEDMACGYGTKVFGDAGDVHNGMYWNDVREGHGSMRWRNGDEYEGNWKNGEIDGFGCYRWHNSNKVYEGQWENGKKHGPGILRVKLENPTTTTATAPTSTDGDSNITPSFIQLKINRYKRRRYRPSTTTKSRANLFDRTMKKKQFLSSFDRRHYSRYAEEDVLEKEKELLQSNKNERIFFQVWSSKRLHQQQPHGESRLLYSEECDSKSVASMMETWERMWERNDLRIIEEMNGLKDGVGAGRREESGSVSFLDDESFQNLRRVFFG